MKRLKIGLVLDDTLDTPDGVAQYVLTLGPWLTLQGHEVHYLVGETKRSDVEHVHSLSRNIGGRFNGNRMSTPLPASRRKLTLLLEHENFDVLHVQMPYSPLLAGRLIKAAPRRTAIVGTFHILPYSKVAHYANHALSLSLRSTLRLFDEIFTVSQAAQAYARRVYKVDSIVLPNVVDVARFQKGKPTPQFRGKGLTIVFLGRFVPRKGCKTLLEAVDILQHRPGHPAFHVFIAGKGPLKEKLERYATDHSLDDVVSFVGFVAEEDKPDFLASADVAVYPSSGGESFGIVLIEAMAAGSAVVLAGDNPGYRSVMSPRPESLFPASDSAVLAEKLTTLLKDSSARKSIVAWQADYVHQFDVNIVGKKLITAYEASCDKRNK